jgi:hypothetical protein
MQRSSLRSVGLSFPYLFALASLAASPTARSATPDTKVEFVVNVGAAIQPFVANYGQDAEDVQYAARSFGGTVFVRSDAISVALAADSAGDDRSTLTARFAGCSALDVVPGPFHGALANFYLGAESDTWLEDLPSYAALDLVGVAAGVDISVDASGRDLRWSIDAASPAAVGDLVWTYDNLTSLELAPDGSLIVGVQAYDDLGQAIPGEERTVRIAKPRAWQTGKGGQYTRDANFVLDGDMVRVEVSGAWSSTPVLVEVMTRYSEVRHGQDTQRASDSVWAEGSSDPFLADRDADASVDMLGVRYDAAGQKVQTITVVGGEGNSAGHGLGLSPNNARVWMSGTTVADDFPTHVAVQPFRAGGRDAVFVELDEDGHLISSSYYGGPGDDEGDDLEVDADGVLWLAGKAELPIDGPAFEPGDEFGTSFSDGAGHHGEFFVTAIETESLDVIGTTCVGGNTSNGDVAVSLDELGEVWIGQPTQPTSPSTFFFPYAQTGSNTGCDRVSEGWGFEALCWKYNLAHPNMPWLSYYPNNSNDPLSCSEIVSVTQSHLMNSFEANSSLFTLEPPGSWEGPWALVASDINTSSSGAEVALAAALYMHRWGSPVYANGDTPITTGSYPDAIGIHEVVFRGADPSDDPAQACTGFVNSTSPSWQSHPIYQVAENCALNPNLQIHDLEYSYWNHNVNPTTYYPSQQTGSNTNWYMPAPPNQYNGVYIGDPPDDEAFMVEHISEYAAMVGPTVSEDMMIVRRWYDGGVLVDVDESVESAPRNF